MSKEATARSAISTERAMKLALEALNTTESDCGSRAWEREQEAITALREALTSVPDWASEAIEQPAQQDRVRELECVITDLQAECKELMAQQQQEQESLEDLHNALQRIDTAAVGLPTFEVRHEGGLDAVTQNIVDAITALHTQPAQQEPVAWMTKDGEIYKHECWPEYEARPLVFGDTSQPAQQDDAWKAEQKTLADEAVKCATEALANPNHPATMAAREYYGAAQRKPLTFSKLCDIEYEITHRDGDFSILKFARAIEAAHGIKENT